MVLFYGYGRYCWIMFFEVDSHILIYWTLKGKSETNSSSAAFFFVLMLHFIDGLHFWETGVFKISSALFHIGKYEI